MFVLNVYFLLAVGKFGICVSRVLTCMSIPQYKPLTIKSLMRFLVGYILHVWSQFQSKRLSTFFVTIEKGDL